MKSGHRSEIAKEFITKFPGSPKQAVARVMFARHPEVFRSVEDARLSVRYVTGAQGKRNRAYIPAAEVKIGHPSATFEPLPEGFKDLDDFTPFVLDAGRTLSFQDVHVPYYDRKALESAVEWGLRRKIDTVLLNGDIMDCYGQSHWETDPRKRNTKREVDLTKSLFAWLRGKFPRARFVWKFGNHEERHERYLMVRCPELLGLAMLRLERIVEADHYGIEVVRDMRPIRAGNLYVLHGHEYKFAISNPVNPARGLYLRAKKSALCGHFHQESSHTESDISEDITTCWSVACLCDLHPGYMPLNKWCHGVAAIEHKSDGAFMVENKRIFKGAIL